MKKTFYSALRAMCVGAMTLAAVSCYDDSFLRGEIEGLEGELAGIEARLDSLEKSLNNDVKAINTALGTLQAADEKLAADLAAAVADVKKVNETLVKLDAADGTLDGYVKDLQKGLNEFKTEAEKQLAEALAKIAVVNVEKNSAGNYVLTFANGETLEVSANTDNTGVITTVEVEGVTYWAVVGADGKKTVLDATVHPDTKLAFKVDPDTNELLVAYDGVTYEKTEVIVNDNTTINVVEAFQYTEGAEYVTLTVGGKEYQLPMYEADNSELTFGRDEVYFAYGASKKLALASEGIAEYYVMSKPDGWKANVEGGKVVVTAPTTAFIEMGVAADKGELLIHATTETGACKVVKVDLLVGPGLTLSYVDGTISYFNALAGEQSNFWGDTWYDFQDVWFGLATIEEVLACGSFEAYMATQPEPCGGFQTTLSNIYQYGYVEGEYEEFEAEITLETLVEESWCGYELVEGEAYVLWAVPAGDSNTPWLYDQAVYVATETYVDYVEGEAAYNNVTFNATFFGADGFVVGATSKTAFDDWGISEEFTYEMALQEYLMGSWQPGPLPNFNGGDRSAMGKVYTSGSYEVNLKDILLPDYGMIPPVNPTTEYFVWVLPYVDGKDDYTMEDLHLYTCKTEGLKYSTTHVATVTLGEITTSSAAITFTPPTGGTTAFELYTAEDFEALKEDGAISPELVAEALKWNWATDEEYTEVYESWMIEPATSYVVVTYSIVGGEYSVTTTSFSTPEDSASAVSSPDKKQWITVDTENALAETMAPVNFVLDLGITAVNEYSAFLPANTFILGMDYFALYGESDEYPQWVTMGVYGEYNVVAEDETSGSLVGSGFEIPYSNYTGTTCTFDFSYIGAGPVDFKLLEEEVVVNLQ